MNDLIIHWGDLLPLSCLFHLTSQEIGPYGNYTPISLIKSFSAGLDIHRCKEKLTTMTPMNLESQSSSLVRARTCAFLPSCSSRVTLPVVWIKGSVAFPGGFPTRLSHRAFPRATVVWVDPRLESRRCAGKTGFPVMNWDIWGILGMVARPWNTSRLSCGEHLLLRCDGNTGNSFPNTQGKDPSSRARRRKRVSSGCGRDSRASSRVETCMSGNFLSCSKGVKDPLELPEDTCD